MAKSQNRQVDKVERKARLEGVQRQRKVEERELRNMNRIGWQEMDDSDDGLEQDGEWPNGQ